MGAFRLFVEWLALRNQHLTYVKEGARALDSLANQLSVEEFERLRGSK